MKFAIIEDGAVINVALANEPLADNWIASEGAQIGDLYENGEFVTPQVATDPERVLAEIVDETQQRLDAFAQTRNYDSILSACTYATSTVFKFQTEGQCCVESRDATWQRLYEILGEVAAGTRPLPDNYADVESELPVLAWPVPPAP